MFFRVVKIMIFKIRLRAIFIRFLEFSGKNTFKKIYFRYFFLQNMFWIFSISHDIVKLRGELIIFVLLLIEYALNRMSTL